MIPDYRRYQKREKLKPEGHSAFIESLIQPAIIVGSTLMSAIAAYVLAIDEISHILDGRGMPADWFVVVLSIGTGFLIDMAIIVSATRYKMHAVRNDPREDGWRELAKWVLIIGLTSETMTLFYFVVHLNPVAFPGWIVTAANWVHSLLTIIRGFLPPASIAFFAAGILPVAYDRADRNREIKSRTSSNVMLLIDRLSEVYDTDDKAEMLRALGGQLMLDTYATYDDTTRTTEEQQLRRDSKLLSILARIHRLDWSTIAADVAPELAMRPVVDGSLLEAPTVRTDDEAPTRPPTGPGSPAAARQSAAAVRTDDTKVLTMPAQEAHQPRRKAAAQARARRSNGRRVRTAEQRQQDAAEKRAERLAQVEAWLAEDPAIATRELTRRLQLAERSRISESTVTSLRREVEARGINTPAPVQQFAQ